METDGRGARLARALLRSFPPGLGHLRAGRGARGAFSRGLFILGGLLFLSYVVLDPANYAQPPPPWGLALAGAAVLSGFWLYAARDLQRLGPPLNPSSDRRGRGRGSR